MDDGADDDDLAWPAPSRQPPPPSVPPPHLPPPDLPVGGSSEASTADRPTTHRLDRGGAAVTAGLFGALAGLTLPPLLFWITFTLTDWLGLPDTMVLLASFAVAVGGPGVLLVRVMGILGRSSPRYDGARTALTIGASVSMGMWLLLGLILVFGIFALRSMGGG